MASDDRPKLPRAVTPPPLRDNRDWQRPKTNPHGIALAIPHEVAEEVTGVLMGDELRAARQKRPTHDRLDKLEETKDDHIALFGELRGQLGTLVRHAEDAEAYRQKREEREAKAAERERIRKWIVVLIGAVAGAVVTVLEAVR